ncbi:MAG: 4-hydroxy-tetrahydrodipicolinate synthase [Clostridiales bacterium]|nr:4-hydroxy-tetrahydrodipicolinate synthase [Clostridiales bacterium]
MKKTVFTGAGVAIVTPFNDDNTVNYELLGENIEYQIAHKTDAIVICATTGESPTLNDEEHIKTIKFAIDKVNGRIPVIASAGSNDTEYAVHLAQEAEQAGADALLLVTPYYNKTSQKGLIEHFTYIADRVNIPIILYNVPSRTGLNIKPETYLELSKHPNIVATKEANGDLSSVLKTRALCGDNLDIYSGNDDQITAIMALGGKGVISVLSNVVPEVAHDMAMSAYEGDIKKSAQLQVEYADLCNDLFIDVNPIPVKEAMCMMGCNVGKCRLPLTSLSDSARETLRATLKRHGLVK